MEGQVQDGRRSHAYHGANRDSNNQSGNKYHNNKDGGDKTN